MNVDHECGAAILRDAVNNAYLTAISTEQSGSEELNLEYGSGGKP